MLCRINQQFEYEFDVSHNLLNNLRIMCQKDPLHAKRFIPEKLFFHIKNGYIIPAHARYYSPSTNKYYELELTTVLSDQLGDILTKDSVQSEVPVIQIEVEGFRVAPNGSLVVIKSKNVPDEIKERKIVPIKDTQFGQEDSDPLYGNDDHVYNKHDFKKIGIIIGIAVILIIGAVFGLTRDTSVKDCISYLENNNYQEAISLYNESISGKAKKEQTINPLLENEINENFELYCQNITTYDAILSNLIVISEINNSFLSELAKSKIDILSSLETSRIIFEEGMDSFNGEDYIAAIEDFLKVSSISEFYDDSQVQINSSVERIIEPLSGVTSSAEAENGILLVEKAIGLLPDNKSLKECLKILIRVSASDKAEKYVEENDYKNAFTTLNDALNRLPADEELSSKLEGFIAEFKTKIFDEASKSASENDYSSVFTIIENAINIVPDEVLVTKLNEYHSEFETITTDTVNALVIDQKYDEAMEAVDQALSILDSDTLKSLKQEIEEKKEATLKLSKEYTASNVDFVTYTGSIKDENDVEQYSIIAQEGGNYRFEVSDMFSGFEVNIAVYAPDGSDVSHSSYGLETDEGITASLETGKTYTVKVSYYRNTGDYVLSIGQQKKLIDITNMDIVHDSIEYMDQKNRYEITTTYAGKYRFDFANVYSGFEANITVYDDHNYDIGHSSYGLENNEGLTLDVETGRTYRVVVYHYRGTSSYDFYIGKQSATQQISRGIPIPGEITFTDQKNKYDFIADSSGEYTFTLSGMNGGVECNISVFDDHDYKIGYSSYGLESGESITAMLEQGKQYRIVVYQYRSSGAYTLNII